MDKIEARVENLEKITDKHAREIDILKERSHETSTRLQVLDTKVTSMSEDVLDIKKDIKDLIQKREEDHYIKPLDQSEKIKFQIIGVVIGVLISGFLAYLFPQLM